MGLGTWLVVILLIAIIMVLPIIPVEDSVQLLGHTVLSETRHVSILELFLGN